MFVPSELIKRDIMITFIFHNNFLFFYLLIKKSGSNSEELLAYQSAHMNARMFSFQAEAAALWEAVKFVKVKRRDRLIDDNCKFFSDNKLLVEIISLLKLPTDADWRTYRECHESWKETGKVFSYFTTPN